MHGDTRSQKLFVILAAFFVANAILAEFIGVKIFALEDTLGLDPLAWNLFGQSGSLNFTAGTLLTHSFFELGGCQEAPLLVSSPVAAGAP